MITIGDCDWKAGGLSGCVYNVDPEVTTLVTQVYGMSAWTNPLHPEVFPGIRKMEAEIVQMAIDMFNGGNDACGTVRSPTVIYNILCKLIIRFVTNIDDFRWFRIPSIGRKGISRLCAKRKRNKKPG